MALTFDGFTIENSNFIITAIDHYSIPVKDMDLYKMAYANKSSIATTNYPSKLIKVTGYIQCDDTYSLEAYIDIFKGYLTAEEADLDIDYNGGTRRYTATANKVDVKWTISSKHAYFDVEFICTDPFGRATTLTSFGSETGYTSATLTVQSAIFGTAPIQLPIITITLNTVTGTGDYIQISNDKNGQVLLIYGQGLADDDVIVIDSYERTVTVNGVLVDYLGTFLEMTPGNNPTSGSVTYSDGFDTRNIDIDFEYYKRYL